MPPKKPRRTKASRPAPPVDLQAALQEQPEDPRCSPPPDEEELAAAADLVPELKLEPKAEEAEEDAPARRRAAPRVVTNFSEDEKELIIDFLQQNPTLYSKRLAGFKDAAAKDRLWTEQARQMKRTPNELKTWYDSIRTRLGKLKKAVTKSGQAADSFTATEQWIWERFQFLLEHITQMPRRTVASFTARLQPAAAPAPEAPEDAPPAGTPTSTHASSPAGANPDLLMGLLETFLTERQSPAHPATAFGSYVDGSLRSLPPALRRTAEARIMEVLHECQNEADRQWFQPVQPQQPAPADRQ
ncbi:hypothetical protein GJAV_G00260410 [Gymnothorax javanicus]|nr:hypothetical protein GJAV_G00260410 [Gymnothorax javanicus]